MSTVYRRLLHSGRLRRPRRARDAGSTTVEVLLFGFPVGLLLLGFVVVLIRLGSGATDVGNAAADAARAASLQRTPDQAVTAAQQTATANLAAANSPCSDITVNPDVSQWRPGGVVTVTVFCTVTLSDLPIPVAPSRRVSAHSTSPIDVYRGTNP